MDRVNQVFIIFLGPFLFALEYRWSSCRLAFQEPVDVVRDNQRYDPSQPHVSLLRSWYLMVLEKATHE